MTLDSLIELTKNPWFAFGARLCMWASPFILSAVLWVLYDIRSNTVDAVAAIRTDVTTAVDSIEQVVDTQTTRADVSDGNFAALKVEQEATTAAVASLDKKFERIAGALEVIAGRPLIGLNWRPQMSAPDPPLN